MSSLASLFTPTGLPRFRQPRHARQTIPPESSHTLQRSMLGSAVSYDTEHSPRSSRTDLLSRTVVAAASTESFSSLARDTMMVDREDDSTTSETMTQWLRLDLGSLALTDTTDDIDLPTANNTQREVPTTGVVAEVGSSFQGLRGPTTAGLNSPSVSVSIDPAVQTTVVIPAASSPSSPPRSPGPFLLRRPGHMTQSSHPYSMIPAAEPQDRNAQSGSHSLAVPTGPRPSGALARRDAPRTYLRDGSIKLPKGHPFASSLASHFAAPHRPPRPDHSKPREPMQSAPAKLIAPVPPTPTSAPQPQSRSAFPSDHYPDSLLGKLVNEQQMDIDEFCERHAPTRPATRHHPSDSFLSFGSRSPGTTPSSRVPSNTPSTLRASRGQSPEDTPRARPRPQSRNSLHGSTRSRTKPVRPSRLRRPPPPPPTTDKASLSGGSTSSGQPNMRDSVEGTRPRAAEGEPKAKIPRLSRHAHAISLHDELFPSCLPPFPTRSVAKLVLGSPSPQGLQDEVLTPEERRPNSLALMNNNASRLSLSLKEIKNLGRRFGSSSRTGPSEDQENVAPAAESSGVEQSGETLFTRPAPALARRGTGSWFRRSRAPQMEYKEGYEPQEHFASVRGHAPAAPVSEETLRCRSIPTMDSITIGPITGIDFTEFKKAEAARVAKMNKEANSVHGRLKRKMSQLRALGKDQNDW